MTPQNPPIFVPAWRLLQVSARAQHALKLLALTLMVADHVHLVFFHRQLVWLYWLSRLVFPIFALIVAQNLEYHRANPKRYILRLIAYGIIAQPFYLACFHVAQLNVMFTLASSIAVCKALRALRTRGIHSLLRYGLALLTALSLPCLEFGLAGVLAVPVFAALIRRGASWDWLAAFILAFGIVGFTEPWLVPLAAIVLWVIASKLPDRARSRSALWTQHAAYVFYPLHLAIIVLVSRVTA